MVLSLTRMNCFTRSLFIVLSLSVAGCTAPTPSQPTVDRQQITQVSILNALMLGHYDGVMPLGEVLKYGDFGLGTCDHLDGELIVLDGKAFQAKSDGTVVEVPTAETTPFAVITFFDQHGSISCDGIGRLQELEGRLDTAAGDENLFVAVRVEGAFESITFRSVGRQEPPYQPLVEVAKKQSVWTQEKVKGTLVGIRSPKWVGGLSVAGYHWHFLSDDRKLGGHVLECNIETGTAKYDPCSSWLVKLGESASWSGTDIGKDLSKEIDQVERMREGKQ
jgi:acetolactate decarboxylase